MKWNQPSILGYSDTCTVKLDFDDTDFKTVKYWAYRTKNWFRLNGFIILKSSEKNYHVVFDRPVSWTENFRIMSWVSILSKKGKLKDYALMQGIKGSSTLRFSPKGNKPSPRIVYRYGEQDDEIKGFLQFRGKIRDIKAKTSIELATSEKTT